MLPHVAGCLGCRESGPRSGCPCSCKQLIFFTILILIVSELQEVTLHIVFVALGGTLWCKSLLRNHLGVVSSLEAHEKQITDLLHERDILGKAWGRSSESRWTSVLCLVDPSR